MRPRPSPAPWRGAESDYKAIDPGESRGQSPVMKNLPEPALFANKKA